MKTTEIGTDVSRAADILRGGGLVGLPTETVYGLAANALDPLAVASIFQAKERPLFDPLIVHLPEAAWWSRAVATFPEIARDLAQRFWPGPLTLLLPKSDAIPDLVTSGLPNVGVRVPQHPLARAVIQQAGVPLAAPSANLFGRVSPTTAQHVADQLGGRIDYILDGGQCSVGVESTVLELSPRPRLLRPGGVSLEELQAVLGPVELVASTDHPGEAAQTAPGMLPQHYAPRTPLLLHPEVPAGSTAEWGFLAFQEPPAESGYRVVEILSPQGDLREAAVRFFATLRDLDQRGLAGIVAETFPEAGLGRALNDRLRRAAARTPGSALP